MAEEVTKTIENVDRLFSEIVVNGEVHESQNYVPPVTIEQTPPAPVVEEDDTPSTPSEQNTQGEDVYAVELNEVLHPFVDQEATQDIQEEANIRRQADNALQQSVSTIQGLIPNQASAQNKLADKDFVNSSIATNTANFLGTYTSMADIEAIQDPTNNDYVFLQTTDASGNNLFDRYKYNADQNEWLFEYELNNSNFTAEQWATINSGLTQSSVDQDIQDAINALDVASQGGNGKYIKSIEQVNGEINATERSIDSTPTQNSSNPVSSGGVYEAIHSGSGGSNIDLQGTTYSSNTYADDNPKIRFKNEDASQNISLTFTDYDAVQSPASLTLNGNQGGEYFIAPNIKVTNKLYGRVNLSSTAGTENGDIWVV
jgi:hypothetical protein